MGPGEVFDYLDGEGVGRHARRAWLGTAYPVYLSEDGAHRLARLHAAALDNPSFLPPPSSEYGALRARVMRRAALFAVGRKGVAVLCRRSLRLVEAAGLVEPGSIDPASLPNEQMERASAAEARAIDARIAQNL